MEALCARTSNLRAQLAPDGKMLVPVRRQQRGGLDIPENSQVWLLPVTVTGFSRGCRGAVPYHRASSATRASASS
jgi:hypothetical protein